MGTFTSFRARSAGVWRGVLDVLLILWIVRIPLASVAIGLALMAFITEAQDVMVHVAMADARLAEAKGLTPAMAFLAAAVFLLWAMPVHYAARLLLETDHALAVKVARECKDAPAQRLSAARGVIGWAMLLVPRVLGALTFVAFAIGAWAAIANLPTLKDVPVVAAARTQLGVVAWVMLACVPVFYLYTVLRARLVRWGRLGAFDRWLEPRVAGLFARLGIAPREGDPSGELHATGRLTLLVYALGVVAVLVAQPLFLAERLPLAMAVPLIFGGWVPILAYLSSLGRRWRFPLVTAALGLGAVLVAVWGDNHAVRLKDSVRDERARPSIREAVDLWMAANGCTGRPAACPRPVIVAAAGGASRAGFFMASVVGHFLDVDRLKQGSTLVRADKQPMTRAALDDDRLPAALAEGLDGAAVRNRIFALSGVSGGAYGAAVVAAALAAVPKGAPPPCPRRAVAHWFGGAVTSWRDCLEAMTSGDYLTASFFGLAFHDQVQIAPDDRASLLERAWENRFAGLAAEALGLADPRDTASAAGLAANRLSQPFLGLPRTADAWVPFLVLNGTSVDTGQRIVTSDLHPIYAAAACPSGGRPERCPVFTHALDFHELIPADKDVRLSTAATNSARFPVISPPGAVPGRDGRITDRIVDGGYFENFGAESALDLAKAITAVEPALAPFILVVSNDPQTTLTEAGAKSGAVLPQAPQTVWFGEVAGPLGAFGAVRGGRGRLAVAEAGTWLASRLGPACDAHLAHVMVWPETSKGDCPLTYERQEIRAVAMSWWLSKPVQMNLREQIERTGDSCNNDAEVRKVWAALAASSDACRPPAPAQASPPPSGGTRQTP
ncbi:hypothetical protein [Xanthobacter sp. KR7-225]|uniref:hypothetical protein n=1 Tax=Xanthobacter sp. KR7-225 TaxID=3156613 RepID=UPI0032B366D8